MITITGTMGDKYLVSGMPVKTTANTVLKIEFENNTAGPNLSLCAGSMAAFNSGNIKKSMVLASSGGPGFQFLTIVDTKQLSGKVIYVLRETGTGFTGNSKFTINIE